jgi:Methyltransferase domain
MGLKNFYFRSLASISRGSFPIAEKLGFYIINRSYYGPIPESKHLNDRLWEKPSELVGIDLRSQAQVDLLREISQNYKTEFAGFGEHSASDPGKFFFRNGSFGPGDAHLAYGLVRKYKPQRMIEIGSGNSTLIMAQAVRVNQQETGRACQYTVIDPYPRAIFRQPFPGLTNCVVKPIQDVPLDLFSTLGENDILFIDSSHVLKLGSDVQYQFLEILPRLAKGVLVHFHDIFLPYEYNKSWAIEKRRFWNEQYILQAFLTFNEHFEVIWGSHYMHMTQRPLLLSELNYYAESDDPGSFWIRKIK